ncbi:glycerophosphodiester phosphodiesterase family protein [Pedobacter sp. SYSU D00535]|uniref:glycerophosphodiester phosphodiesterase n=1 Tax=Pedobacter sp. SYSU D00535 TaxID=2810308 RepID=UPI001F61F748|nr:glycerophosphodiester phosphodiesterase family protein [Pedobacter sp. SYSU D00535]
MVNKILPVMVFLLMMAVGSLLAQVAQITLSNYTFSPKRTSVGVIAFTDPNIALQKIVLSGVDARLFKVKQGKLILNQQPAADKKWLDLRISAETKNGPVSADFRLVKDEFLTNKVIAHRGAWKHTGATENSIAALKHAIAMGCQGSEFDVHMSADSVPFINHDPHLGGVSIAKSASKTLSELKLSNGESLPTLRAYLENGMNQNQTKLILEIKPSELGKASSLALSHKVMDIVRELKAQAWVEYISFDYDVCKELQRLDPYVKVAYLNGDKTPAELAAENFYGFDYNLKVVQKNKEWIKQAQEQKLTVNVWTVNDPDAMDWLLEQQVDFITTNEPELLLKKISKL